MTSRRRRHRESGETYNSRWRKKHRAKWSAGKRRLNNQSRIEAFRERRPWEKWEIDLVLKHECSDREIATKIGRSRQAIIMKRHRLKNDG